MAGPILMTDDSGTADVRIACDMTALSPEQRERHAVLLGRFGESVLELAELHDGYSLRFLPRAWAAVSEYVELERRCCPFITFVLRSEANGRAMWLEMTGSPDVKAFLDRVLPAVVRGDAR